MRTDITNGLLAATKIECHSSPKTWERDYLKLASCLRPESRLIHLVIFDLGSSKVFVGLVMLATTRKECAKQPSAGACKEKCRRKNANGGIPGPLSNLVHVPFNSRVKFGIARNAQSGSGSPRRKRCDWLNGR